MTEASKSGAPGRRWTKKDFQTDPVTCATAMIGAVFLWDGCGGVIVETEAYAQFGDEACHTFVRNQAREFVVSQPAGTIYTYLNYGVHWLFNVLTKSESGNGFVLVRAVEPTHGVDAMKVRRDKDRLRDLCSGPGKLTQAMGIGPESHGSSIINRQTKSRGIFSSSIDAEVVTDTRIGITKAADYPWRFLMKDNRFVSRGLQSR